MKWLIGLGAAFFLFNRLGIKQKVIDAVSWTFGKVAINVKKLSTLENKLPLTIEVSITNDLPFTVSFSNLTGSIYLQTVNLATFSVPGSVELPSGQTTKVLAESEANLNLEGLQVMDLISKPITTKGSFTVYGIQIPFEHEGLLTEWL